MKLNTGSNVEISIDFEDRGVSEKIYFNPTDPNLPLRFSELQDRIQEKLKELENIQLNKDGTVKDFDYVDTFSKINEVVYNELDYAFGNKVSDIIFKYCSPFAVVNGEYFILQFINEVAGVIKKHVETENKGAQKKLNKYIGKYKK